MTSLVRYSFALVCGFVGLLALQAADKDRGASLVLETAYFDRPILGSARTVTIEVNFDGKGGGKGTLTLDPNIRSGGVSTLMADTQVKVTLKKVEDAKYGKDGRQVYEISGKGLEPVRLAVPEKSDRPVLLLIVSKDGKVEAIDMVRKKSLRAEDLPQTTGRR